MNLEDPRKTINGITVAELFGGSPSKSGKSVNSDNALTISAAWRAIQVLGGAGSSIPCKPLQKNDNGKEPIKNHPTVNIFTNRVNAKYTTPVWMDRVINHLHLRGNHYAYPIRNGIGQVVELRLENPDDVTVYEDRYDVVFKIRGDEKVYRSDEFIHVPHLGSGVVGKSTVSYAKDDFGNEMSRKDYTGNVWASGGKPPGLMSPSMNLTPNQRKEASDAWKEAKQQGGDVIVPFGFTYTAMGFRPDEVEYLQAGGFSVADMSRWFGVPRHKLYDPEGISYNSNEHAAIEFLADTMAPVFVKIEYEYASKIYQLPREQRYFIEFDMSAYVRPDTTTRYEAYAKAITAGVMTPAEARMRENLEFRKEADRLFIQGANVPLDKMDEFITKKNTQPVSEAKKAKLKELLNGKTEEAPKDF